MLTSDGDVFTVDHNANKPMKAKKQITLSKVVKIEAGTVHFLALKKVYRPPFSQWNPDMVENWVRDIDFDSIANVIKYGKVTGKILEGADWAFIQDNFGMKEEVEWKKL